MSIIVPSNPDVPNAPADVGSNARVTAEVWEDAAETQHFAFARTGARIPGHYYTTPATTTSTTYTQANLTAAGEDLDVWMPTSQVLRLCDDSGDVGIVELQIFGTQVKCRLLIYDLSSGSLTGIIEAENTSGTTDWASGTVGIDWAETFEGDSTANDKENFFYRLQFKATSGTASLVTWAVHEAHISAASLP